MPLPSPLIRIATLVHNWLKPNITSFLGDREPAVWLIGLMVGIGSAVLAILFREGIGFFQFLWIGFGGEFLYTVAKSMPAWQVFMGPVVGGLVVGLLLERISTKRTGGVADVIEARALSGRKLSKRDGAWSALITAISLGSGASAGREGPVVHLGATLASALTERFSLPAWSRRTLLGAGVASAISASFNAPIAGVLFAHEVILGHYSMRSLVPIVISSTAGAVLSRLWFGNDAAFSVPEVMITSFWEFPAFALLGITAAIAAILFQIALFAADFIARKITIPLWLRPVLGGVIVGAMGTVLPQVLGVGYDVTNQALHNQMDLSLMLVLIVAKTAATAITLTSRFGGGIFSPALYLGALTGSSFGLVAASVFPHLASSQGLYAVLGMGAVAGAVLGAPISTAMIVFELTGGYALSIALLLTVAVAQGVTHAIHGHSWFQWQLEMRGLFVAEGPHRTVTTMTRVSDFMEERRDDESPDVDPDSTAPRLRPSDSLEMALRAFDTGGYSRLPVIDPRNPDRIIAWATQVKALTYFNRALVAASEEEHK